MATRDGSAQPSSSTSSSSASTTEPTSLTIRILEESTDNFSKERIIGQGSYGTVYRGVLENGEEIAVKVLYNNSPAINDEQFKREFCNLMRLNHKNTIRLVGYCYETRHQYSELKGKDIFAETTCRMLCFEYMPMGSLKKHLSDETQALDWRTRYNIIKGICEGLKYLHEGFKEPIYHLDLKPDNILLDQNMVPKLADFGLSKLYGEEQTRVTQSHIGTIGYIPLEYFTGQLVSKKFDIFSLGVVITQIIAGPKGHSRRAEMSRQEFLDQVHANWRNRLEQMCTSETLEANCRQVSICTDIGLRCMDVDRDKRPNILEIIDKLDATKTMIEKAILIRMLVAPGDKQAWDQIQEKLAQVATYVANPGITVDALLGFLEGESYLHFGYRPEAKALLPRIMGYLKQETIRTMDTGMYIPRLRELLLVVADQLDMLPLCDSEPMHMIDTNSDFCDANVAGIIKCSPQLSAPNASYAVVSIVGAETSGKSYLLNRLFGTKFPEMDVRYGRRKTTRGIMMSRCIGPSLLVLDVEGFDGTERGQDRLFEKQAVLFALTVSDVMLVNINVFDIGRELGGGTQVFKTIFKERRKLPTGGLTNILVVLRMYNVEVPIERLKREVMYKIKKIWKSLNKESLKFEDCIEVYDVIALPDKYSMDFQKEVTLFRNLLSKITIDRNGSAKVPVSSFSVSSRWFWDEIKNNEQPDIWSHQEALARLFCRKTVDNAINSIDSHKDYKLLKDEESPRRFREISDTLLESIVTMYDHETKKYDPKVRDSEREYLLGKLRKVFIEDSQELIRKMLRNISEQFKGEYVKILKNMEETDAELNYDDQMVDSCVEEFRISCKDLKEFDSDDLHMKCVELQKHLQSYTLHHILTIKEKRVMKEAELGLIAKET